MENKKVKFFMIGIFLSLGLFFNIAGIGKRYFNGYSSVGNFLIACSLLLFAVTMVRKKKSIDERMVYVASKAKSITLGAFMVASLAIMVVDGIIQLTIPYSIFMSYLVSALLLVYIFSYHLLLKNN